MRFKYKKLYTFFFFLFFILHATLLHAWLFRKKKPELTKAQRKQNYAQMPQVRVLLAEQPAHKKNKWLFYSADGFWITLGSKLGTINEIKMRYPGEWLSVNFETDKCILGKTIILSDIAYISPYSKTMQFNDVTYHGRFEIRKEKNKILCINSLPLEKYVRSVLRSEGWPGWPLEVYKSFAIMCRTYVISMIQEAQQKKRLFHVKNTNAHQTYTGKHKNPIIKRAVLETEGTIIGFENRPILAMFDSCCGGVVPANIESTIDFKKAPYLARKKACTYCKNFAIYSWSADYSHQDVEKLFAAHIQKIGPIKQIKITKKDTAGLIHELQLIGKKDMVTLSGQQFYSAVPEVKSFCFTLKLNRKGLSLSGKGYGHHIGLCQWGARKMVDKGYNYKKILDFYYPGTQLMQLT